MKINNKKIILVIVCMVVGIATGSAALAAKSGFNAGDARLCGSLAATAERLKKKGYFKAYPAGHADTMVRQGGLSAEKIFNGGKNLVQYRVFARNGKIKKINYRAIGVVDGSQVGGMANYLQGKKMAEKMIGAAKRRCTALDNNNILICDYRDGNNRILIRFTKKDGAYVASATSNCK